MTALIEDPEPAAHRELEEETGHRAASSSASAASSPLLGS